MTEKFGETKIIQPEEAASFWQPVPANGFVRCILNPKTINSDAAFSMGTQTVAPGCYVREHTHDRHEEVIHFLSGEPIVSLDGVETKAEVGTTVFIGCNRKHSFINAGSEPLTFLWLLMPGGLEDFFEAIGRERDPEQPAPEPFPRPENVAEIERNTVFGWAQQTEGEGSSS